MTNLRVGAFAIVYSCAIVVAGLWFSFATGEWVAIACALGLVVFPIATLGRRTRGSRLSRRWK